jgi:alpha-mannosidase
MKRKVWILPHTHYDAEVFLIERETLEIGYTNLIGALKLLREEPSFRFALDQTCYIEPFLKTYPEEKDFLQKMIDEGRLEIVGGMHSMPDENIPSGESYIRNVIYAKQSIEREFNVDVRGGWPIDTFGHHPQIPQLMVKSGFDYAAFQRLMKRGSPSEFWWQGLDGTRLFCHWMQISYAAFVGMPSNLYEFTKAANQRIKRLEEHAVASDLVAPDGADIMPVEPHLVKMVEAYNKSQDRYELIFATPSECMNAIKASGNFPTVTEDLNPAFQGTYSARIDVKKWNRKLENLLVNAEKFDSVAQRYGAGSQVGQIWDAWRGVLFNQAHDIICGAHIDPVFEHTIDRFKYSETVAEACLETSLKNLTDQIDTRGIGIPLVVFNPLGWERSDVVECTVAFSEADTYELAVLDAPGNPMACDILQAERYDNGSLRRARVLFIARDVPAFGYQVFRITKSQGTAPSAVILLAASFGLSWIRGGWRMPSSGWSSTFGMGSLPACTTKPTVGKCSPKTCIWATWW